MAVEMNKSSSVRLTPVQEIKLAKPATELYVGQILKTVVVTALTNNQVLININGQNLNAKSSHHFTPGELLEVKVVANHHETILEVQQKNPELSILQNALLQALPKQAPPTNMLQTLTELMKSDQLPYSLNQQIKSLLNSITGLTQLPQQFMQAINQSGIFLESTLLDWRRGITQQKLKSDFKGQCFKLLNCLPEDRRVNPYRVPDTEIKRLAQDPLPLPGAIPQPLSRGMMLNTLDLSLEALQHLLRDQINQVIARITANQINHLSNDHKNGYLVMLDLPVKTEQNIDVIPLMIKQHKAEPMQQSRWSLSFALNLTHLGALQATITLNAKHIDIKINTQNASALQTLDEYQLEMKQVLADLGLKLRNWNVQAGLEENHIDVANLRLLDIRI
ncbi:flagellar hook-length control protein FliK [Legionella bononiensis]|uniref:Flagellar hook-length control protein FliK n=2 Tax=Legionella bononiensis TaxID=2793102 RepID=A0ABS1WA20_9GAMM|nr:flagellar hook-length control protein FliK [Legionella bononiensis]MBL7480566.1 flagellar hook-length control protein FliK [Legionella bononiensis]MBL7526195.1 flagellar hook-length control protein FliK [Legionella bononiensis]MBL7563310.1 flagellar hook-length control protein FliK [Legionella bononiensis]